MNQQKQPAQQAQPATEPATTLKTCLGCGNKHPFHADGTPVGGTLPCGH